MGTPPLWLLLPFAAAGVIGFVLIMGVPMIKGLRWFRLPQPTDLPVNTVKELDALGRLADLSVRQVSSLPDHGQGV